MSRLHRTSQGIRDHFQHFDEAQLSCTSPGAKRMFTPKGVVFLKKENLYGLVLGLVVFAHKTLMSLLQLPLYLTLSNDSAEFTWCISPKTTQLFIHTSHVLLYIFAIIHHLTSRSLFTIHRSEKYQLGGLVYLSSL